MELDLDVAREIAAFIYARTGHHAILCDAGGTIQADSAGTRIGLPHKGAKQILAGVVESFIVTREQAEASAGKMKEGVSLPIVAEGRRIGTVGIAGPVDVVAPVASIAIELATMRLAERHRDRTLRAGMLECVAQLNAALEQATATIGAMGRAFTALSARSTEMVALSSQSAEQVKAIVSTLALIRRVADQTRMLGLNAAIEAARAGEHGKGFAVVADGVRRLADESGSSAREIGEVLGRFQAAFDSVVEGARGTSDVTSAQARTVGALGERFDELRSVGRRLAELAQRL